MSQAFRFPTLNKNEQHQTLQERLDAAQRVGLQQGYEEGLAQGAANKQSELEQQMEQQIELRVAERLEAQKTQLIERFNTLFDKANNELLNFNDEFKQDLALMISTLAEHVIDCELKVRPEIRAQLIEKAITLLSNRDVVTKVMFSGSDRHCFNDARLAEFLVPVYFDEALISGDVELVAEQQTHRFSFSERLQSLLDEVIPEILKAQPHD